MSTAEPTANPQGTGSSCCGKMKSTALWTLVLLNVALVLVLIHRHAPENRANAAVGNVAASEILAVPGSLPGFPNGVVFLMDSNSDLLTAISYDSTSQQGKLSWLPQPIDIRSIVSKAGGPNR